MAESSQRTDAPLSRAHRAGARRAGRCARRPADRLRRHDLTDRHRSGAGAPGGRRRWRARRAGRATGGRRRHHRPRADRRAAAGRRAGDPDRRQPRHGVAGAGRVGADAAPGASRRRPTGSTRCWPASRRCPGVVPEHKGVSASVHYRSAPDPEAARSAIVRALGDVDDQGLRINHGRMIVEVRPVGLGDKGSAARAIVERFGAARRRGARRRRHRPRHVPRRRRAAGRGPPARRDHRRGRRGGGGAAGAGRACDVVLADPAEVAVLLTELSR